MGVLEIFDKSSGGICLVSLRYFILVLEMFYLGPGDILWVSCTYLMGDLDRFDLCY